MKEFNEIQFIKDLVSFYSPYGNEKEIASYLVDVMKNLGFESYLDNAGNAIGVLGKGSKQILFAGHMDVFPGNLPVRIEDNKLYGRGSVDAKGCIATFISACKDLVNIEDKQIIIVYCVEEEGPSSKGARELLNHHEIKPEYIFIGEPSGWDSITIGYKGVISFKLEFETDNFHHGTEQARAIDQMLEFLSELKQLTLSQKQNSFFDSPNLEVREIKSDNNGIKERCQTSITIRIPDKHNIEETKKWINEKAGKEIDFGQSEPAFISDVNNEMFKTLRKVIVKNGGKALPKKKYGTSDMNILGPHYNVPTFAFGPGDSKLDHTANEHLDLDEYQKAIKVLKETLISL